MDADDNMDGWIVDYGWMMMIADNGNDWRGEMIKMIDDEQLL